MMVTSLRRAALPLLGFLLLQSSSADAQRGDSLQVGARYRVTLAKLPDRIGPQLPQERWLMGELTAQRGDSLVLRPHPLTGTVAVPLSAVDRLEISRGVSRGTSAAENTIGWGLLGALWSWELYHVGLRGTNFDKPWHAVGTGAAIGAGTGLLTGILFPTERWRRVRKPVRP